LVVLFLWCFFVVVVVPAFFSVDSDLVSVVFLLSVVAAAVGFGAGAADCWAIAATGSPSARAMIRDFFISTSPFSEVPTCTAVVEDHVTLGTMNAT